MIPDSFCGWKNRTLLLLGILTLLLIIGGVVGGVLSSSQAAEVPVLGPMAASIPAPTSTTDALLEELILLNTTFEKDLWQFGTPTSAQYQALAWMKNDTIVMSPD